MIGFEPGGDGPATDLRLKGLDVNPDFKRGRVESRYDRVDHLLHPFFQRCEERTGKAFGHRSHFLASREHGASKTAVFGFHFSEAWKHGADAQLGRCLLYTSPSPR